LHYDRGEKYGCGGANCGPNCDNCKRFVEIWNLVFMQYFKNDKGEYELLSQTNIDTGIGFERLVSLLQEKNSSYETDLFKDVISKIEEESNKKYEDNKKEFRVIADHSRAIVFLTSEGIIPSNVSQGYVLRRLIRRSIRYSKLIGFNFDQFYFLLDIIVDKYKDIYPEVVNKKYNIIKEEEEKFAKTIEKGLLMIEKLITEKKDRTITGEEAFDLYQSYGFPLELVEEIANEKDFLVDKSGFNEALKKHQDVSREGMEKKFGGVGKDSGEMGVKYHTLTHLLHAALRKVLGDHVKQMGSDINSERLRFDFAHGIKMTEEEIKKVEDLVNEKIKEGLIVEKQRCPLIKR
jgi:alanyl-tRNA synthetase